MVRSVIPHSFNPAPPSRCMDPETRRFYDADPRGYSDQTFGADMSEARRRFASLLRPGARVLDLGCGSGRDTVAFRAAGFDVVPVDGSEGMCRVARENTGSDVRLLDFADLDYGSEFDGVWACASLLHLPEGEIPGVLAGIRRALVPGGVLHASFKKGCFRGMRDGRLYTDMEPDALAGILGSAGFRVLEIRMDRDARGTEWVSALAVRDDGTSLLAPGL